MESNKVSQKELTFLIDSLCDKLRNVLLAKNGDYGFAAFNPPVLCNSMPPEIAILVRMSDKISRLANLGLAKSPNWESYEDTILDLAGYCILYLAAVKGADESGPVEN